jgi:hypothetical protein
VAWRVLDASGNVKLSTFGSGASLPDPVTVAHGGTGLTTVSQGDLLYASADGVISRLAKDATGTRVLTNLGTSNAPTWTDPTTGLSVIPRPTVRKSAWTLSSAGGTTPTNVAWSTTPNATTGVIDASSGWLRYTTGAVAGNQAGIRVSADWCWLDHEPFIEAAIRTGSTIANCTIWVALSNVGAGLITNSADQHLLKGCGFRFDSASDSGMWVPWTADGTTQTIGTAVAAIAASTIYTLTFKVNTGAGTFDAYVNNGTHQTTTIGAAALGTAMRLNLQITNTAAAAKSLDISSFYGDIK